MNKYAEQLQNVHNVQRHAITSYYEYRVKEEERFPEMHEREPSAEGRWATVEYLMYGDYDNQGMVGRANVEEWQEFFEDDSDWWTTCSGPHGYNEILLDLEHPDFPNVALKIVDALSNYPILNDNRHSELEYKDQQEQWDLWGRSELLDAIKAQVGLSQESGWNLDETPDELVDQAYQAACSESGRYTEGCTDNVCYPFRGKGVPVTDFITLAHSMLQGNARRVA